MEGNESTALIGLWELRGFVDLQIVRRPVSGKRRDRRFVLIAVADFLTSVAAIFRGEHELLLCAVVEDHDFLRRKLPALLRGVELRPVLMQLVAAVLGDIEAT